MRDCILAIDLGTTNCKCILVDESLTVVGETQQRLEVTVPFDGAAEQHPDSWWRAVSVCTSEILRQHTDVRVAMVGLSGQMHGLVALDSGLAVLRPCILWNDQRSGAQCSAVYDRIGGPGALARLTRNAMLPGYAMPKLLWMREHEPQTFGRIAHTILPKDYVRLRLTGELGTDPSDASGFGSYAVHESRWSEDLLSMMDLPIGWMPPVRASGAVAGTISAEAGRQTGIPEGTPVTTGGGDAVMQTVGSGTIDEARVLVVIGTGGNVTVTTPVCLPNEAATLQVFAHVIPDRFVAMGVTLSAGSALDWAAGLLAGADVVGETDRTEHLARLVDMAGSRPPGAGGLVFVPYLRGERCPYADPSLSAAIVGLRSTTTAADIVRCVMEGVALSLKDVLETLLDAGIESEEIVLSGGGSTSPLWRQIDADVLDMPVQTLQNSTVAGALGAVIVAGLSAGMWDDFSDVTGRIPVTDRVEPVATDAAMYRKTFETYRSLHPVATRIGTP